jgi:hypothetical protein
MKNGLKETKKANTFLISFSFHIVPVLLMAYTDHFATPHQRQQENKEPEINLIYKAQNIYIYIYVRTL